VSYTQTIPAVGRQVKFADFTTVTTVTEERGRGNARRRYLGLRDWRPSSILLAFTRCDTRPHKLSLIIITMHDSHVYHPGEGESKRACVQRLLCVRARI